MNPNMFQEARKNMNPQMMKTASEQLKNMSNDQLNNLAKMAGLNVDPEFLKNSANMMSGMSDEELNRLKNMAGTMNPGGFGQNASAPAHNNFNSSSETQPKESPFPQIDKFRVKGNDLFKNQNYGEASNTYFEGILELEEFKMKNKSYEAQEMKKLEIALRSNYSNCKAKTNEFEIVLNQAKEILKLDENNGKAYYRLGQALDFMGRSEAALINLEKAEKLMPQDATVTSLLKAVREKVGVKESPKESAGPNEEEQNPKEQSSGGVGEEKRSTKPLKKKKVDLDSLNDTKLGETKNMSKEYKEKEKQWEQQSHYLNTKKTETEKMQRSGDVIIEEEEIPNSKQTATSTAQQTTSQTPSQTFNRPFPMGRENANVDQAKASIQQLKNMDPNQLKMMTDTFKNMDKGFLKNMMKSQTGVEMSDAELDNIKNMMTPEMLQMVSSMNLDEMNLPNMGRGFGTAAATTTPGGSTDSGTVESGGVNAGAGMASGVGAKPSLSSILQNQGMISSMMENMKKNPEMLKNMSKMLGENHPLSSMLERSRPEDLSRMIGFMQGLLKIVGKITALYRFLKLHKFKLLGALGLYLAYKYF